MALQSQRQARFWTHDSATHTTACGATLRMTNFEYSACTNCIILLCVCVIVQGNSKLGILVRTCQIIQNMVESFLSRLLFFILASCFDPCLRLPGQKCRVSEPKRCNVTAAACPQTVGHASHKPASCHVLPSVLDAMFPELGFSFGSPVVLG